MQINVRSHLKFRLASFCHFVIYRVFAVGIIYNIEGVT